MARPLMTFTIVIFPAGIRQQISGSNISEASWCERYLIVIACGHHKYVGGTILHAIISAGVAKQRNNYREQASVIQQLLGSLRNAGKMNEASVCVAAGSVPKCENLTQASKRPRSVVGERTILPMLKKAITLYTYYHQVLGIYNRDVHG